MAARIGTPSPILELSGMIVVAITCHIGASFVLGLSLSFLVDDIMFWIEFCHLSCSPYID